MPVKMVPNHHKISQTRNSSITSYKTSSDGKLETLDVLPVLKSPVASTLYGPGNGGLAVAF